MIRFDSVGFRYGTGPEVLRDLSFRLNEGSFHYLTGTSGAGKSTLLRLLHLTERPTRGLIHMFGHDIARADRRDLAMMRRHIGMVFQDFALLPHLSVFDNVALPLRIAGEREAVIRRNVHELLEWVGLGDCAEVRPATLSGGQQQRIAIARAVVAGPRLLLADEPTGSVDDEIGIRIMRLFEELNRQGTAVVLATHNRALAERFPHPHLRLEGGMLLEGSIAA